MYYQSVKEKYHLHFHFIHNYMNCVKMNVCCEGEIVYCNGIERNSSDESDDAVLSEDQNSDTFGLEFAASQWQKLVFNAEDLFSKLITSSSLSLEEKNQIEQWLCLKQECEECVTSDDITSTKDFEARVLDPIDEVTETDEQTEKSLEHVAYETIGNERPETDTESDIDSQNPDLLDRLAYFMGKFKNSCDEIVRKHNCDHADPAFAKWEVDVTDKTCGDGDSDTVSKQRLKRRSSILLRNETLLTETNNKLLNNGLEGTYLPSGDVQGVEIWDDRRSSEKCVVHSNNNNSFKTGPYEELKVLAAGSEVKQSQMRKVLVDLEGAQKRIEELQRTIQIKEQFISDMIKNSDMRSSAKQRFQKKRKKLEEGYYKTRSQLAQSENALILISKHGLSDELLKHKREIEKYKSVAINYERRLNDIEMMKQIASESAKKILELENSLLLSKRQMERLEKQLRREEKQKEILEKELIQDQNRIKELEHKYNLQLTKLNEIEEQKSKEDYKMQWIHEEEKRITSMRESSQKFKEQLIEHQLILEKREALLKEKLFLEKICVKNDVDANTRISFVDQLQREKSNHSERSESIDDKEIFRQEIRNLRKTRDSLVDQRCYFDKLKKENKLSVLEERKLLEHDEAIEAIDAAIEYKNELICGRKCFGIDNSHSLREKDEDLLISHLMKLSAVEMQSLLRKYFLKAIDLKESGKKMEIQLAEMDIQNDNLKWKIHELTSSLYQTHLDAERRIVLLEKEYQEKLHLMLRHCAEDSSTSSGPEGSSGHYRNAEISQCMQENKLLKRRVNHLESLMEASGKSRVTCRAETPMLIPQKNLKQLQGPSSHSPTTKVTRKKNKLIIQQEKSKENL